ncbi:MAG TPA: hypothetical protein VI564_06310, partial [Candidatus Nanoarchaeia archaeon]|nr:hypothetical protein [Candidatus Nanoarchaeia archaeon]
MAENSYAPPDFGQKMFKDSGNANFKPVTKNGVAPGGFYSTSNLPTYVKIEGNWKIVSDQRMDSVILNGKNSLCVKEISKLKKGNLVLVAESADGTQGVFEHYGGFGKNKTKHGFEFMSSEVSREKPVDYSKIAAMIEHESKNGFVIWVIGPAIVHSGSRDDFSWIVENGYVSALFCGNAVAVHDSEMSMFGTSLDMKCDSSLSGNHGTHMKAINEVRNAGSLKNAVDKKIIKGGIIFSCIKKNVPMVIAGSIRDDGPMPDTITDSLAA